MQNFQKSSLAHILAVSGTHVSYIILGLTVLITHVKISKRSGYIFIILLLIFFLFLTNFSVSVIRACIMAIIFILSKLLYKKADTINTLIIALLITIVNNPFSIYSVSLQLSYLGTIGVIFLSPIIKQVFLNIKMKEKFTKIISVPIAAQIAILPIMIINFNTVSFTFLISNIIAIPLLGCVIIGGYILTFISFIWFGFAKKLSIVLNIFLKLLIFISKVCANLKISNIYVVKPSIITIIIYYFSLVVIIYAYNLKNSSSLKYYKIKKVVVILIVIIIVLEFPYTNYNGKLKIYFIDVGQRR